MGVKDCSYVSTQIRHKDLEVGIINALRRLNMNDDIIKLINRLLDIPCGEQLYAKEIQLLFKILEWKSRPVFIK